MKRKHYATLLIIVLVLGALVYLQVREWRRFDWDTFESATAGINWLQILVGVLLIHLADFFRAIRWKIFLRPTRPETAWHTLIAPQYVGFAGLALLGRPGELIRPYLISLRARTSFASQMAIWFVERAFDTGAVALVVAIDLFALPEMRQDFSDVSFLGYILLGLFAVLVGGLYAVWRYGSQISSWSQRTLSRFSPSLAQNLEHKIHIMSDGLHAVRDVKSFLQATGISFLIWMLVAFAYRQVLHAFAASSGLPDYGLPQAILLMGASVAGGVAQLPFIGGGAQLATIAILNNSFNSQPEVAVAAGIMFWLVTFISVAPLGLVLAHFEHVSLRKITEESESKADAAEHVDDRTEEPA
ncbi:MAG: lysylphosphatidylglycerol synthase transmembrane domain-containing protein [Terriglobales bacterium]